MEHAAVVTPVRHVLAGRSARSRSGPTESECYLPRLLCHLRPLSSLRNDLFFSRAALPWLAGSRARLRVAANSRTSSAPTHPLRARDAIRNARLKQAECTAGQDPAIALCAPLHGRRRGENCHDHCLGFVPLISCERALSAIRRRPWAGACRRLPYREALSRCGATTSSLF